MNIAWLLEDFIFIAWDPTTLIFLPSSKSLITSYKFSHEILLRFYTIAPYKVE